MRLPSIAAGVARAGSHARGAWRERRRPPATGAVQPRQIGEFPGFPGRDAANFYLLLISIIKAMLNI